MKRPGVLFITYTGLLDPLGQSQVLAYQERLSPKGAVHVISFEPGKNLLEKQRVATMGDRAQRAGVHWRPGIYYKRPTALTKLWDISNRAVLGVQTRRHGRRLVRARSGVASVITVLVRRSASAKYLLDMCGFCADERLGGGMWPRAGRLYRVANWFEQRFPPEAGHVNSSTRAAIEETQRFVGLQGRMTPVPAAPDRADLQRFGLERHRDAMNFASGCVDSAGTWFLLSASVLRDAPSRDYARETLEALAEDFNLAAANAYLDLALPSQNRRKGRSS